MELLGGDSTNLRSDWSASRATDPLEEAILQMLTAVSSGETIGPAPVTH